MNNCILRIAALIWVGTSLGGCVLIPESRVDMRLSGAYAFEDGSTFFITPAPRDAGQLRYRMMDGTSGMLYPVGNLRFEGGAGWTERQPVAHRVSFAPHATGRAARVHWEPTGTPAREAHALPLRERIVHFQSDTLTLRGKLVLPEGDGPFAAVVLVHGSEADSAVDYRYEPYLYAAHGFAALVFDKRGTGESAGKYVQNFAVLAQDVAAAISWLRGQTHIDPAYIHLAGFSQGGWVAPLAAALDGRVRSMLIGYGVLAPVTAEDRWGYIYALRRRGFDNDAVAAADRINTVIEDIFDRGVNRWGELGRMLRAARSESWLDAVTDSDSMLGFLADTKLPLWTIRLYVWWRAVRHGEQPFIDRLYDPLPTMQRLNVPSLWILAGEDSSAPTEWTLAELHKLASAGRPVEYHVYPYAEHGIVRFTEDASGVRRNLAYEPDYLTRQIEWLRRHSGQRQATTLIPPR